MENRWFLVHDHGKRGGREGGRKGGREGETPYLGLRRLSTSSRISAS